MNTATYLRPRELAVELRLSVHTLEKWRKLGKGPEFLRLGDGRLVLYARSAVDRWLREQCSKTAAA